MTARQTALSGLQLALDDRETFASITGPKLSGKSQIIAEIVDKAQERSRVCITILNPGEMDQPRVTALKRSIEDAVSKLEKRSASILIVVDNFHSASSSLLMLLTELARERYSQARTQAILAGEPELWSRLDYKNHGALVDRLALRFQLKAS